VARFKNGNLILENEKSVVSGDGESLIQGKNLLINGDFSIWQRGTTFSQGVFTADRWLVAANGGDTITTTRQSGGVGTNYSGHNAIYTLQMTITAGGGTDNNLINYIEDVRTMQGKTVTLSAWVYSNVAFTLTPYLAQIFGAGGSSNVTALIDTKSIPQSVWTKITMTGTLPSISGKTIGTSNSLAVVFQIPGNVTHAVYFMNVQLESGDVATDFEQRDIGRELALCQRYFQKTATGSAHLEWLQTLNSAALYKSEIFPVTMRATPTMTFFDSLGASGKVSYYSGGVSTNGITPTGSTATVDGFFVLTNSLTNANGLFFGWEADAEL